MSLRQYHSTSLFPPTPSSSSAHEPRSEEATTTTSDLNRASSLPLVPNNERSAKGSQQARPDGASSFKSHQTGNGCPPQAVARNKTFFSDNTISAYIEPESVVFKIPRTSRRRSPCPSPVSLGRSFKISNSYADAQSGFRNDANDPTSFSQNEAPPAASSSSPSSFSDKGVMEPNGAPPNFNAPVPDLVHDARDDVRSPATLENPDVRDNFMVTHIPTTSSSIKVCPETSASQWHNLTQNSCNPVSETSTLSQPDEEVATPCLLPQSRNPVPPKQRRSRKFRRKDSLRGSNRREAAASAAANSAGDTKYTFWKQRLSVPKHKAHKTTAGSSCNGGPCGHSSSSTEAIALYTLSATGKAAEDPTAHQFVSHRYKMFKCQRLQYQQQKQQQQLRNQSAKPAVVLHLEGVPLTTSYDDPTYPQVFPLHDGRRNPETRTDNALPCNGHSPTGGNSTRYSLPLDNGDIAHQHDLLPNVVCRQNHQDTCVESSHCGEFTVVPINNETNLREQEESAAARSKTNNHDIDISTTSLNSSANNLRVPNQNFEIDGEPTDSLTQNTITSLLSAKFRDVAKRWKQYGVESPRFRKRIHSKWESMNYDLIDSELQEKQNAEQKSKRRLAMQWLAQWLLYFLIGVGTAFLAAGVQISVEVIAHQKFGLIKDFLDKCSKEDCLIQPVLIWIAINAAITLLGAALVTYVQPMAAGSGIPMIKSYLNGVRIPGLLSLRAFVAKCVGVILSILGGLACGKEGPMAHSGGIMGAGLGKGRIPWFGKDINLYGEFRNDHSIRDLVAAGAASGVSAAFGAPVGGTLFSVEEAASFWNTELVWKVFFSAMIACFSTNFLLSAFEGHPTQLSNPGLVRFNTFPNLTFDLIEIPVFIVLAVIGGLTGSLFVVMNYKLTVFRQKYLHRHKWIKIVEAALVAVVSAVVAFILMYTVNDCTTAHPYSHHAITTKMGCDGDSHNAMSTLFLTTPEGCLKSLLHDPLETYSVLSLILFIIIFFLLGVWTYGLSVSSGVFIPSLAIGAAWGRLIGMGVVQLFPDQAKDVGKYALIGAASQLGGILRTTISLTVIIVECTGDISFGLCIMIALMISKWVGDFFTTGLYDMNVEVSGIPLLSWEPPPLCDHVKVADFMSQPVMSLLPVEKVGHVVDCLKGETFHGFPVIEQDPTYDLMYRGKLKGLILRTQLLVLLKRKAFCKEGQAPRRINDLKDFDNPYPISQRLSIDDIELSEDEKDSVMDLTPYMSQTPYFVSPNFSMPRAFRLFRGLGLRHLIVINDNFEPVGMITRKDLAVYRAGVKKGMLHMEQLTVENR